MVGEKIILVLYVDFSNLCEFVDNFTIMITFVITAEYWSTAYSAASVS